MLLNFESLLDITYTFAWYSSANFIVVVYISYKYITITIPFLSIKDFQRFIFIH